MPQRRPFLVEVFLFLPPRRLLSPCSGTRRREDRSDSQTWACIKLSFLRMLPSTCYFTPSERKYPRLVVFRRIRFRWITRFSYVGRYIAYTECTFFLSGRKYFVIVPVLSRRRKMFAQLLTILFFSGLTKNIAINNIVTLR